jgi:hypothetical protein
MNVDEYTSTKFVVLNTVAPKIIELHKLSKAQQVAAVRWGTGSDYLAHKWDGDFAHRYLNSDSKHQPLWLKMLGIPNPTHDDCYALHQAMLFFYNHPLTHCIKEDWLKRNKIDAFGNGLNWCKLWLKLDQESKNLVIKFF